MSHVPRPTAASLRLSAAYLYVLWTRDELPVWAWNQLDGLVEMHALFAGADLAACDRFQITPGQWRQRLKDADPASVLQTALMLSAMPVFS